MAVGKDEAEAVRDTLQEGETIQITARQRRLGPGGSLLDPTRVIVTNRRIIIINRSSLKLRREYESIPYRNVASVRLERGVISSSLLIRVQGTGLESKPLREDIEEGFIDGLNNEDAKAIANYIDRKIGEGERGGGSGRRPMSLKRCPECGTENIIEARHCISCGSPI
jgi:hypothetical protein